MTIWVGFGALTIRVVQSVKQISLSSLIETATTVWLRGFCFRSLELMPISGHKLVLPGPLSQITTNLEEHSGMFASMISIE